jgi:hypothetical protein
VVLPVAAAVVVVVVVIDVLGDGIGISLCG